MNQPGRNDPCPCGSGKKYKKCCANISQPTSSPGQDMVGYAFSLFETGRLLEAQQVCESIIATEPRNVDALHILGLVSYQQGNLEEAEKMLASAVKIQPENAWIQNNLAMVLIALEKINDAYAHVQKAIKLMPGLESAHNNLGLIYRKTHQFDEAEKAFKTAVKLNPHDPSYLCNVGEAYLRNKKLEQAQAVFEKAIQIAPGYLPALNNLGLLHKELKEYESALRFFQKALTIDNNDPDVLNNMGTIYMLIEDYDKAKECYQKVIDRYPAYVGSYINLGDIENTNGNKEEALNCFKKALHLEPNSAQACIRIADYFLENYDYEKSGEYYLQAIENNPNYIEAIEGYLSLIVQQERWIDAEYIINKALPEFPDNTYLHIVKAEILLKKELSEEAINEAKLAVSLEPSNVHAYITLGKIYGHFGMLEDARKTYHKGLEVENGKGQVLLKWANLEEQNNKLEKAEQLINEYLALEPDEIGVAQLLFAKIERRKGNLKAAINQLEEIRVDKNKVDRLHQKILFEKGNAFDKLGDYDKAFYNYLKAAELRKIVKNQRFEATEHKLQIEELIAAYSPEKLANLPSSTKSDSGKQAAPVFIVGFPRSGTTLLEQILCSHPDVSAGGELVYISHIEKNIIHGNTDSLTSLEFLSGLDQDKSQKVLDKWRNFYLDEVRKRGITNNNELLFTDKMPLNVTKLPLISMLFPESPIIHIVRNPMDVCLSSMFSDFKHGHEWLNSIDDAAVFYKQTTALVEHFKQNLPMRYLELRYEDLVAEQEDWSRKIIGFVGLPWDEQCLQFHKTKRVARTASYDQVNQKIYKTSVARYKNYEKHLAKPLEILEPVMKQYGYL